MKSINITGASGAVSIPALPLIAYRGFSLRETAGAPAVLRIYDNASAASGTILDTISLAPLESARECYSPAKNASVGLYVQVVSGTVEGSINYD